MQLLTQCYETVELLQIRSELEKRGIRVHIADEFTYAIPGMPGAEQPRGVWVADEDFSAARIVIRDLLGEDRIHKPDTKDEAPQPTANRGIMTGRWLWLAAGLLVLFAVSSWSAKASALKEDSPWICSPAS